jgi:HEAT repeat protein
MDLGNSVLGWGGGIKKSERAYPISDHPSEINSLLRDLEAPQHRLRRAAIRSLAKLGTPEAIQALFDFYKANIYNKDELGIYAWMSVHFLDNPQGFDFLVESLRHPERAVRYMAAGGLAALKDERAIEPLLGLFDDPDNDVCWRVGRAMHAFGDKGFQALSQALKHENEDIRSTAAWALGGFEASQSLPLLLQALEDPSDDVRYYAVRALGELGDPQALPALLKTLEDPDVDVRAEALGAMGHLDDSRALGPLCEALADESSTIRAAAAYALHALDNSQALPFLLPLLADPDHEVRGPAALAIGNFNDPQTYEPLVALLNDPEGEVRSMALSALEDLADPRSIPIFVEHLHDPKRCTMAARALAKFEHSSVYEALLKALSDQDYRIRGAAAESLGKLRHLPALDPLILLLKDPVWRVRREAASALGRLEDGRAVEPLLQLLNDDYDQVRASAIKALGRLGNDRAIPALQALLQDTTPPYFDPFPRFCDFAATALQKIGSPQALALLADWLAQGNEIRTRDD